MSTVVSTPHYENLERVVIGRMIISMPDRLAFGTLLTPADFALPCRAWLFRELQHIAGTQTDAELITAVCQHARWPGKTVTNWQEVAEVELTYCIGKARGEAEFGMASVDEYAKKLRAARVIRRAKEAAGDFIDLMSGQSSTDLEASLDKLVAGLQEQQTKFLRVNDGPTSLAAIAKQAIANLDGTKNVRTCGYTHLECVHKITGPFQLGCTYIIAGGPGSGKTALAAQIARDVSEQSRVIFITIENTKVQLAERALSSLASVPIDQWKHQFVTPQQREKLEAVAASMVRCNMEIEDAITTRTYEQIVALVRKKHRESPVGMFVIDYLQRVSLTRQSNSRNDDLEKISGGFRDLAAELQISLVLLSSTNREGPKAARAPQMTDLRGCGQLEFDAHTILAMHERKDNGSVERPKYLPPPQYADEEYEGVAHTEIHVLKQRDGENGAIIPVTFHKKFGVFAGPRPSHPALHREARN